MMLYIVVAEWLLGNKYSIMEAAVEFQIEKTRGREEKNNDFEMIFREIGERKIRLSITLWGAC